MRRYGLIGYPLHHSFSKDYFSRKFANEGVNAVYDNFPLKHISGLPGLIDKYPDLHGLNVTHPYKTLIIEYLDDIDGKASDVGAVNVISITGKGMNRSLKGFNTDIHGFILSLKPLIGRRISRALVLGTGGASRAVQTGLDYLGVKYSVVSRDETKGDYTYTDISGEIIRNYKLIINATPLGMYPDTDSAPDIPYESLTGDTILFDLVYNPETSRFLMQGQEKGCRIKNGKEMLLIQAEKAWEIWNRH